MGNSSILNGLGGTVHGSFFRVDDSVDVAKPPGATKAQIPTSFSATLLPIITGQAFIYSPNSSWFLLTCAVWYWKPYQLNAKDLDWNDHLRERMLVNHCLAFIYIGFWHLALYWWNWGNRPFVPNRTYQWGKVMHNVFYTWLGILQWTVTEVTFLHCYQTGKIPHRHETFSLHHPACLIQTLLVCILVPNFRDVHFYFAHRMIHSKFLYKFIHSIHHRNTDIEPFSGLCMHPVEHMFYYTCYAPCLFFHFHPMVLFWMGVHVVISPAASHSGYEDHFSADLVHYLHHRYNDCNYGVPQSIPFDVWFGTYQGQLKLKEHDDKKHWKTVDPKARLGLIPEHPIFNLSWVILWCFVWWNRELFHTLPVVGAIVISMGPVAIAFLLELLTSSSRRSMIAPFDKDLIGSQVLHFGAGFLLGILPASYLIYLVLA